VDSAGREKKNIKLEKKNMFDHRKSEFKKASEGPKGSERLLKSATELRRDKRMDSIKRFRNLDNESNVFKNQITILSTDSDLSFKKMYSRSKIHNLLISISSTQQLLTICLIAIRISDDSVLSLPINSNFSSFTKNGLNFKFFLVDGTVI
jgi:hypothetical protein